uniref:Uncharacterized protein n=1 Tax=Phyllostachys edulis TaxID=38705 RepID=D3IVE1_PHYED|nr:hypothetical protein [Phyllostachys edulis]
MAAGPAQEGRWRRRAAQPTQEGRREGGKRPRSETGVKGEEGGGGRGVADAEEGEGGGGRGAGLGREVEEAESRREEKVGVEGEASVEGDADVEGGVRLCLTRGCCIHGGCCGYLKLAGVVTGRARQSSVVRLHGSTFVVDHWSKEVEVACIKSVGEFR